MLIIACYFDLFCPELTPLTIDQQNFAKPLPVKKYILKHSFAFAAAIMNVNSLFLQTSYLN